MSDDPYSRHYWRWADEYPDLYERDDACALWYRLVRLGDMAWPSAATLPVGTKRRALDLLVSSELIDMVTRTTYRIRGMDKERASRSDAARRAVDARWRYARNTDRNTGRNTESIPSRAEPSRAEPSSGTDVSADALDAYYRLTATWPSQKVVPWLNRLSSDHGDEAVSAALAEEWKADADRSTLLSRTETRLEREAHEAKRRRAEADRQRAEAERRRIEEMPPEKRAENMARLKDMLKGVMA